MAYLSGMASGECILNSVKAIQSKLFWFLAIENPIKRNLIFHLTLKSILLGSWLTTPHVYNVYCLQIAGKTMGKLKQFEAILQAYLRHTMPNTVFSFILPILILNA